eukprot:1160887-Pelagomonas_calceolata.AAC.4
MVGGLKPPAAEEEEQERISQGQGVIFILEDAQLEVAQVGKVRAAMFERSCADVSAFDNRTP